MIVGRSVRRFGVARPVDATPAAELRAWLLELRASLAPESVAGYVRGSDEAVMACLIRPDRFRPSTGRAAPVHRRQAWA